MMQLDLSNWTEKVPDKEHVRSKIKKLLARLEHKRIDLIYPFKKKEHHVVSYLLYFLQKEIV